MAYEYGERFPEYVTAAERRLRAELARKRLARQGIAPQPIVIEGRDLVTTFWGMAWCHHLETLADLATRLPRGRAYARNGSVVHLELSRGVIRAFVSGTEVYEVEVKLRPLDPARWKKVRRDCAGRIATVVELLSGRLSAAVMEVLCDPGAGLFPASAELHMSCSCPDQARLCKHLAAVLYGVGARLDHAPELLFTLRGVELAELIADAGDAGALASTPAASAALVPDERLAEIFGIELELGSPPAARRRRPRQGGARPAERSGARPRRSRRRKPPAR
ncbi:SWIM zinc finger family protein [Anaeromyxobacter sp. Fw109-5]|uniref:SWIM zinc finger family protein n=1 Tax=Anaeromyxobacter sp. (strain Fw109-5) TaxID=404589 RepID=UPI0000ED6CAE|nr:SWIM zinc finger family protein [Anaeromyxobacter sp. Fw109-5]ABS28236.1 zinc finger SWIM domain protein [Anaeromyxobacter sp. Fw109-5]